MLLQLLHHRNDLSPRVERRVEGTSRVDISVDRGDETAREWTDGLSKR